MDLRLRNAAFIVLAAVTVAQAPASHAVIRPGFGPAHVVRPTYVPGEVLVKFRSGTTTQTMGDFASSYATTLKKRLSIPDLRLMRLAPGKNVQQAIQQMKSDSRVEYVQPNYLYYPEAVPTDPDYPNQWGLNNTGQVVPGAVWSTTGGTPGDDISAELAWDHITDCSPVIVAVVDEGINYTQQDLAGNMWGGDASYPYPNGTDFVGPDNGTGTEQGTYVQDNDPMPVYGDEEHGTHVAGIIAAAANNSIGTSGVCWKAQIMSVRALTPTGGTSAAIASGITFAAQHGAKVINLSLGGSSKDTAISNAITTAMNDDAVVVIAAGNSGTDNDSSGSGTYPCDDTQANIVCVAALDQNFNLASFSNYGATSVDVGAPGTDIESSYPGPVITDDFSTSWLYSSPNGPTGGWIMQACGLSGGTYNMLLDPSGWCTPPYTATYASNANDDVYKTFDLSGVNAATMTYYLFWDLASGDTFSSAYMASSGDPITGGTIIRTIPDSSSGVTGGGSSNNAAYPMSDMIPNSCFTSTCSLGFNLTSNNTSVSYGLGIVDFAIGTLQSNSTSVGLMSGTSMATPMVSGIAALVRAYNPNYTYADTVAAIKGGGVATAALSGTTTSGNAANAMGSLAYITTPTGIGFKIQ